ncbi:ester cyclase [Actinacidiphila acidipaludis]|uniref:Ester cyclase n=1 Tax=Actinacidiphila acidipaludis TaxID=2873382 RepID=A0ABS7QCK9_9ACTN|nr:ester cyclase [Streptomyces acidipaludis]MBY8879722.1 ester cyclase [Streptomyces acidipaludis]
MTMELPELGEALFRVLVTGDAKLAAEVVHPRNTNREAAVAPAACALPGPRGTLASGAWMRAAFSDLSFPVSRVLHEGDRVWVRLRMQGTHTGPFVRYRDGRLDQAVPPTGRKIDFEQVHLLDIRDGQVVRHEAVRDDIGMLGQLGVFPPSPAVGARMMAWRLSGKASRAAAAISAEATRAANSLPGD